MCYFVREVAFSFLPFSFPRKLQTNYVQQVHPRISTLPIAHLQHMMVSLRFPCRSNVRTITLSIVLDFNHQRDQMNTHCTELNVASNSYSGIFNSFHSITILILHKWNSSPNFVNRPVFEYLTMAYINTNRMPLSIWSFRRRIERHHPP